MVIHALKSSQSRGRGVLDRVAVFSAAPVAPFLTLLFELLLSLGVGKSEEELDAVMFGHDRMELFDDTFSNVTSLESRIGQWGR